MSADHHCYLGPFIKIKNKEIEGSEEVTTCSNKKCATYDTEIYDGTKQFCSEDGSKIEKRDRKCKEDSIDISELCYEILEESITPVQTCEGYVGKDEELVYLIANRAFQDDDESCQIDPDDSFVIEDFGKENQIKDFKEFFADELKKINEFCGKENVKVSWGLINYWY